MTKHQRKIQFWLNQSYAFVVLRPRTVEKSLCRQYLVHWYVFVCKADNFHHQCSLYLYFDHQSMDCKFRNFRQCSIRSMGFWSIRTQSNMRFHLDWMNLYSWLFCKVLVEGSWWWRTEHGWHWSPWIEALSFDLPCTTFLPSLSTNKITTWCPLHTVLTSLLIGISYRRSTISPPWIIKPIVESRTTWCAARLSWW